MWTHTAEVALLAGLLCTPAAAQEVGDKLCPRCGTTGKVDNAIEDRDLAEIEARVRRCSWRIARDPEGLGLPWKPCERCLAPSLAEKARREFEPLAAQVRAWTETNAAVEKTLRPRKPLVFIETEHFYLVFGLDRVRLPDRRVLRAHAAAHLYADRLEEQYRWFLERFGAKDEEMRVHRHQVFLLPDLRTLVTASRVYAQAPTDRAARAVGDPSIFVTWRDKGSFKNDADFHRHVVHHVTHQLLGVLFLKVWLVERAGWFEEGIANLAEMERFGVAGNTCNTEDSEEDLPDSDWEPLVRKELLRGRLPSFPDLARKRADQLGRLDHLKAWSAVDFLFRRRPEAARDFVSDVKRGAAVRDALRERFGLSVVGFDEVWADWVRRNYRSEP